MPGAGYVLVVEDDKILRDVTGWVLEAEGLAYKTAADCDEARALARKEKPSLVLMDYLLKGASCEELLRADGSMDGVPVILVTGIASADDIAARLRVAGLMKKPFLMECLTDLVKSLLAPSHVNP